MRIGVVDDVDDGVVKDSGLMEKDWYLEIQNYFVLK